MTITASMVKELRAKTGAGMMDCKKALVEAGGDMEKAVDILREKGLSQAAKKASRIAAEGAVVSYVTDDEKKGAILEVNCETDFVGGNDAFQSLAKRIVRQVVEKAPSDLEALLASDMDGKSVQDTVTEAISKIGENISVRRFVRYESKEGKVFSYIHGAGRIGVLIEVVGGDAELGKNLAMQVAAANPSYLSRAEVPSSEIEHEKEVLAAEARNEGKPEQIIEKMVLGRINKYYKEVCLLDQDYIRDSDLTITKLLKQEHASVARFARYQLGEGIEKKQEDFASEVMGQINK